MSGSDTPEKCTQVQSCQEAESVILRAHCNTPLILLPMLRSQTMHVLVKMQQSQSLPSIDTMLHQECAL